MKAEFSIGVLACVKGRKCGCILLFPVGGFLGSGCFWMLCCLYASLPFVCVCNIYNDISMPSNLARPGLVYLLLKTTEVAFEGRAVSRRQSVLCGSFVNLFGQF